jgi:hypothetical protein
MKRMASPRRLREQIRTGQHRYAKLVECQATRLNGSAACGVG